MDRNLQLLGIAKKAGLLAIGGESASASAKAGSARAIIAAGDASEGAKRRAKRDADFCGAAFVETAYTKFELGSVVGRGSPGTLAVLDAGLAARFLAGLARDDPERYGALEDILRETIDSRKEGKSSPHSEIETESAPMVAITTTGKRRTAK